MEFYYGDLYYYMDRGSIRQTFLTPETMTGDIPLFDSEAECLAYYREVLR